MGDDGLTRRCTLMNAPNATVDIRHVIARTTAELLAAVNASDADRCSAVWADDGVLMPPHHPAVQGHEAIVNYFRGLFSRSKFRFAFTSSNIHLAGDIALERVTYSAIIWPGEGAEPIEDVARACTCTGVSQTGRGSSPTISGIAIKMCPLTGDPIHPKTGRRPNKRLQPSAAFAIMSRLQLKHGR